MTNKELNRSTQIILRGLLAIMVFSFAGESVAQYSARVDSFPMRKDYSKGNFQRAIAYYQIECLKNGVLLVRLQTKQKAIDHFNEIGNPDAANRVKKKQDKANAEIISAFKKSYDFTNVYFFSSEYSDFVRAHQLDSIPFLDKHIVSKEQVDLRNTTFLVAELTTLQPDTGTARVNTQYYEGEQRKRASVNSNTGLSALVFKSDQFVQLDSPFPYYARGYTDFIKEMIGLDWSIRKLSNIIAKSNTALKQFALNHNWRSVERNEYALPVVGGPKTQKSNSIKAD